MTTIRVDIVSAEAEIFSGDATMVVATGEVDELVENGDRQQFYVSGGILEVQPQVVTVLADTAARASDLDEAAAQRAMKEAREALANRSDAIEIAEAQTRLTQALAQLQALERLRKNLKH